MPRRKRPLKPKNPRAEDLPQNPEFQEFAENLKEILKVPKSEIDRRLAEEQAAKKGTA